MISGNALLNFIVIFCIAVVVIWAAWWSLDRAKLREPFNTAFRVLVVLVALIFLANLLFGLGGGHPLITWGK